MNGSKINHKIYIKMSEMIQLQNQIIKNILGDSLESIERTYEFIFRDDEKKRIEIQNKMIQMNNLRLEIKNIFQSVIDEVINQNQDEIIKRIE
jgi:hypothetical protein